MQICEEGLLQAMTDQTEEQFFRLHVLSVFFDGTAMHICEEGLSAGYNGSDKEREFNLLFAISTYFGGHYVYV